MELKHTVYGWLPEVLQPLAKRTYYGFVDEESPESIREAFVDHFFDSRAEYQRYVDEFREGPALDVRREALEEYRQLTDRNDLAGVERRVAQDYYALLRHLEPTTVVETGVCNGVSTLVLLLALSRNDHGHLYSIDYPHYADEPLADFRVETYEDFGGGAIPSDKEPGWIVPDNLRERWTLRVGKSQRELPKLVSELDSIDVFVHDSEHSLPCMLFEFEIAHEWSSERGVLVADDVSWTDAFDQFVAVREGSAGKIGQNVAYLDTSK